MSELEYFTTADDIAVFHPIGEVSLHQATKSITTAIAHARTQEFSKLLVNTIGLTGFEPPTLAERYFFVHEWNSAAAGIVRIAVVSRPEMIDPRKFGVTVAKNAGLVGEVFTSNEEALNWLKSLP